MKVELCNCTQTLLSEIKCKSFKRNDIANTYALAMHSTSPTDWSKVNRAIIRRWSPYALEYIKTKAHKIQIANFTL